MCNASKNTKKVKTFLNKRNKLSDLVKMLCYISLTATKVVRQIYTGTGSKEYTDLVCLIANHRVNLPERTKVHKQKRTAT